MTKKLIHGIDPYAPGGIDALLDFHRGFWGDAQMNANDDGGDGGDPPADPPAGEKPAEDPAPKGGDKGGDKPKDEPKGWDGKVESLDPAVQKMINDLRKDAGDERVAKKTLDSIQKALNPDGAGDKPDPEKLAKDLADRDQAAKQAQTELTVYKLAGKSGADADALLDSRSFLAKLKDVDPTDSKAVSAAIKAAVDANPKLKVDRVSGKSGTDLSGGSGEQPKNKPTNLNDAVSAHYGV